MTKEQFAECMVYLYAGLSRPTSQETIRVYFDLLGDLDHATFKAACKSVLIAHPWNTFPSIAELREAAVSINRGREALLSPAEAWSLAWEAAGEIDMDMRGPYRVKTRDGWKEYESQAACVMANLPPMVAHAMRSFGLRELCYGSEPVGVIRGQFLKVFEQLAASSKREAILPPSVREAIENRSMNGAVGKALSGIGEMK